MYETTHVRIYVFLVRRLIPQACNRPDRYSESKERGVKEREKERKRWRESKTPRARRTEEGGEGWLEEGVGTSLTVQPTSYALGPTFRRLLSFSRPLVSSLIHSLILPVSFSVSASRSLPLSRPYLVILPLRASLSASFPLPAENIVFILNFSATRRLAKIESRLLLDFPQILSSISEELSALFCRGWESALDTVRKKSGICPSRIATTSTRVPGTRSN